jgi:hypothetical protein
MIPLPLLDSHTPPLRVMSLHALAYCHRLFYLEEVEEIRVADARVFAGRELHAGLEADEDAESVSLDLASESLGLIGKVDHLVSTGGHYFIRSRISRVIRAFGFVLNSVGRSAGLPPFLPDATQSLSLPSSSR